MTKRIDIREYERINGTPCAYCKRTMDARSPRLMPTRDHTEPRSMGGLHTVWACADCNNIKGNMTFKSWLEFMVDYPNWWFGVPFKIRNCYMPDNPSGNADDKAAKPEV